MWSVPVSTYDLVGFDKCSIDSKVKNHRSNWHSKLGLDPTCITTLYNLSQIIYETVSLDIPVIKLNGKTKIYTSK